MILDEIKIPTDNEIYDKFNEKYEGEKFWYSYDEMCALHSCKMDLIFNQITDKKLNEQEIEYLLESIYFKYDILLLDENDRPTKRSSLDKYFDSITEPCLNIDAIRFNFNKNKFSTVKFNNYIRNVFDIPYKVYEYKIEDIKRYWIIRKLK